MFKKKPQIKNLSPLRSSDRRKLADQTISDYQIVIPTPQTQPPTSPETDDPTTVTPSTQPALTSIRTSLFPENTSSAKFSTTAGANAAPISGTVYVGARPGQDERILWIQHGKEPRLIPTVYTLWHNPNIIPLLHAADFVVEEKLRGGADLMTPGLIKARGVPWDSRAVKGAIVAVADIKRDTVPVWVGSCEIDISSLADDLRGAKGAAVRGLHWEGDEIWNWGPVGAGGGAAPESIEGWSGLTAGLTETTQDLDVDDDEEEEEEDGQDEGGVALNASNEEKQNGQTNGRTKGKPTTGHDHAPDDDAGEIDQEPEPSSKDVDDAFQQAFLYSLHTAKKHNQPPSYGFDFPLQPSFIISNMIQPYLRSTSQHYNIKKTSWKNTKKFIKHLDKQLLAKTKDRNGGETVILDIDFNDQQIKDFQPYRLPTPKPKSTDNNTHLSSTSNGTDPSLNQKLTIQTLYRASSKLVPDLLPSKTTFYTAHQITSALKSYIDSNPNLTQSVSTSRNIRLDPFIANHILTSNSSQADTSALCAGEIDRGALSRRLLEDDHLCNPYHLILRNNQSYSPSSPSSTSDQPKPRPGPPPTITITIEKRTGTKLVTKLSNLEPFHINPHTLGPELQRKCAGSASVAQLVGGKPGMMEIVVQGDQRDVVVRDVLAKRGVNTKWVDVVDKSKGGKKGKK